MKKANINSKGFTIIEVVLVLAIAGLIFLMVFVALPNLQRSQRDTQREDDYGNLLAAMTSYIANNGGKLPIPGASDAMVGSELDAKMYLNSTGTDPNTYPYHIFLSGGTQVASGKYNDTANSKLPKKTDLLEDGKVISGSFSSKKLTSTSTDGAVVFLIPHATCDDNGEPQSTKKGTDRKYAIFAQLEGSGGTYCTDNEG